MKSLQSEFSFFINKMKENQPLSMKTIREYLKFLQMADQSISIMVACTEERAGKREIKRISCYLKYSNLYMGLLNSISSCLFHLGEARLRLLNGLSLLERSHADALKWLEPITLKHVVEDYDDVVEGDDISDGWTEVGWIWFWGCYTVLGALSFDSIKWEKRRRKVILLSGFRLKDHKWEVKEIVEINEGVIDLKSKMEEGKDLRHEAKRVWKMVEVFGDELDNLEKEVNKLFFDVLSIRDKLLDSIRDSLKPHH